MLWQLFFPEPKAAPISVTASALISNNNNNGLHVPVSKPQDAVALQRDESEHEPPYRQARSTETSESQDVKYPTPSAPSVISASGSTSTSSSLTSTSAPAAASFARIRKQLSLVLAGATFVTLSAIITRRAITRRFKAVAPPFYNSSAIARPASHNFPPHHQQYFVQQQQRQELEQQQVTSGPFEAVEALSIASINVFSWAIFLIGGGLWAFDILGFEEFRSRMRRGMGIGTTREEMSDKEVEEEIEEWIAGVLARKEEKEKARGAGKERR